MKYEEILKKGIAFQVLYLKEIARNKGFTMTDDEAANFVSDFAGISEELMPETNTPFRTIVATAEMALAEAAEGAPDYDDYNGDAFEHDDANYQREHQRGLSVLQTTNGFNLRIDKNQATGRPVARVFNSKDESVENVSGLLSRPAGVGLFNILRTMQSDVVTRAQRSAVMRGFEYADQRRGNLRIDNAQQMTPEMARLINGGAAENAVALPGDPETPGQMMARVQVVALDRLLERKQVRATTQEKRAMLAMLNLAVNPFTRQAAPEMLESKLKCNLSEIIEEIDGIRPENQAIRTGLMAGNTHHLHTMLAIFRNGEPDMVMLGFNLNEERNEVVSAEIINMGGGTEYRFQVEPGITLRESIQDYCTRYLGVEVENTLWQDLEVAAVENTPPAIIPLEAARDDDFVADDPIPQEAQAQPEEQAPELNTAEKTEEQIKAEQAKEVAKQLTKNLFSSQRRF